MTVTSKIDLMEKTLLWRHIAPTAPDQLPCYPFSETDPFIIDSSPDIYFAGNQSQFDSKLLESNNGMKTRLITVPNFVETNTFVLVNLSTLHTIPVQIDINI
jgi:DNA polymerase delta subunit 2